MESEVEKELFGREQANFTTRTDTGGRTRVDFKATDFPAQLFIEWNEDCEVRYNGMRWLKMWSDHLITVGRDSDRDAIIQEILSTLREEEVPKEKKEEKTKTFRGEI